SRGSTKRSSYSAPAVEGRRKTSHRPNESGDPSPGLRPKADTLGKKGAHPCGLKGRESSVVLKRLTNGLATLQAAPHCHLSTQGIGLRPLPWAPFSRPVGPDGPATRELSP